MPRLLKLGGTDLIVRSLEIDEPKNSILFSDNSGRITGTPSIVHDKAKKNTSFFGKLKLKKPTEDTKVGFVTENNSKSVGVVLDDNDIVSISYVDPSSLETDTSIDLPLRIHGNTSITKKLTVGNTLNVDDQSETTFLTGNTVTNFLNVDQLTFSNNNIYIAPKSVSSSYSDGTLTINCNFAPFGRCLASGTFTGTLTTYTFNNMLSGSRLHVLLPQATSAFTLSSTISGGVFMKGGDLSVTPSDHVLLEIENINDIILIRANIFS